MDVVFRTGQAGKPVFHQFVTSSFQGHIIALERDNPH